MFNKNPKTDPGLESVIADCERELRDSLSPDTKEYKETLARYKDLKAMQAAQQPKGLQPDTIVLAGTNILGILLILHFERVNVITSKSLGFVKKLM